MNLKTSPEISKFQSIQYLSCIFMPLLICFFIAVFYRVDETNINILLDFIWPESFTTFKTRLGAYLPPLPDLFVYSLPEGLWVFSLTLIGIRLQFCFMDFKIPFVWIPITDALILELFQWLNWTDGTFDFQDIFISIVFWILALIIGQHAIFKADKKIADQSKLSYATFFFILIIVYMADTNNVYFS